MGVIFDKWAVAEEYTIKDGLIRPVENSETRFYDINTLERARGSRRADENYLVHQLLNLNTEDNKAILNFVQNFGLLGLLQFNYLQPYARMLPMNTNSPLVVGLETSLEDLEEPLNEWFCLCRDDKILVPAVEVVRKYNIEPNIFLDNYSIRKIKQTMCEPVEEFKQSIKDFQDIGLWLEAINAAEAGKPFNLIALMRKNEDFKDLTKTMGSDGLIIAAKHKLLIDLAHRVYGVNRIVTAQNDKWIARWSFDSLLQAAYFFFSMDITNGCWVGICENEKCGKLYTSMAPEQIFCSPKCADAVRKRKARESEEFRSKEADAKRIRRELKKSPLNAPGRPRKNKI